MSNKDNFEGIYSGNRNNVKVFIQFIKFAHANQQSLVNFIHSAPKREVGINSPIKESD